MSNVYIHPMALHKIKTWVDLSDLEVSGMGKVLVTAAGLFITDVWVPKQTNSSAETEFDADDLASLHYETRDVEGALIYWWHSHVDMTARWSGTDIATINKIASRGACLASVFNKKGEITTAYAHSGAIDKLIAPSFHDKLELLIGTVDDYKLGEVLKAKCTEKVFKPLLPDERSLYGSRQLPVTESGTLLSNSTGTHEGFKEKSVGSIITADDTIDIQRCSRLLHNEFNNIFRKEFKVKKGLTLKEFVEVVENYFINFQYMPQSGEDVFDFYDWMYNLNKVAKNV